MTENEININRSIERSKEIIIVKACRVSLRQTIFYANRISANLPSLQYAKELDIELMNIINDLKREIARYIRTVFETQGFKFNRDEFWFSGKDLENGWLFTNFTRSDTYAHKNVLFLSYTVDFAGNKINRGEIKPFEKVREMLTSVKPVYSEYNTIVIKNAIKKLKNYQNGK